MSVSYRKLFDLMKEKNIKKIDLRTTYKLNPKTVDSLVNNRSVTVDTIMTLCEILDCQPGDLMEYVKDNDDYVFLVEKESMWAKMLEEVLKDNNIPCVTVPVLGAGLTLKTGMQERLKVLVPSKSKTQAEELMNELFSAEEDSKAEDDE